MAAFRAVRFPTLLRWGVVASRLIGVWIVCIALIPLTVFGLYTIQVASDHLMRRTLEDLQRSVLIDADKMKRVFDMAHGDLTMLNQLTIRKLARARAARDHAEVERWYEAIAQAYLTVSDSRKVYNQIRYLDENGLEVVRVDYDGTHPPRLIPRERLQEKQQRDYFAETMKLGPGQVYTSPPDLTRERDEIEVPHRLVIRYATSLFDNAGNRRGIVIINLMAGPLLDALHQEGKAARKEVYAVDQEGFYLLHPDPAKQWGGPRDLNTGERLQRDFPTLANQLLSRQAGAVVAGEHVITSQSLALSPSSSGPFLVLVERMPTSIVLAAVADFRLYLLILLVGVGGVAVGGAALIGRRLTRPIGELATAADRIRQGDLDIRVEASGSQEIMALGDAFNTMAEGLTKARNQIERQLAELAARQRVTESILRFPDLTKRLSIALQEILALLGPTIKGALYLVERGRLVLRVEEGFSPAFLALGRDVPLDACPWVRASTATCIPWEGTDPITEALRQEGVMAWISLPLVAEEKLVGVLLLANSRAKLMDEDTSRTLRAMVDQVAVALHHARLYTESRERLARLTTLREIDQAIAAQLPLEEVIDIVLTRVHPHVKTDAVGLSLIDWEKKRTILAHLRLPGGVDIQDEVFTLSESLLEALSVRLEPVIIYDLLGDPRVVSHQEIIYQYGLKSYLGVPLIVQGQAIGILHVCTTTPHRFAADEVNFFATLAGQAAISVQNARLFEAQQLAVGQLAAKVEELQRMQSRLIEAERLRAMGLMAVGVAHDFNNALMGILGQAQLMQFILVRGPVAAALQDVEGGTRLLECLTRQEQTILDASETIRKIRQATRPSNTEVFEPVALDGIVEQVLSITQPRWKSQAEATGVQITIQTALAKTPPVLGRAAELREAFTNLLFNALDAMPQGGTLTITTRQVFGSEIGEARTPDPGTLIPEPRSGSVREWIELTVTDTGIGMSPAVRDRLFEPFFSTKGVRGTGLGLSMVYGIVSRHEGEITIQSVERQGTTVTLRLPVAQVAAAEVVPPPAVQPPIIGSLNLLVIDDEPLLAETLGEFLRILGHKAAIATSGKEGLTLLATERFDVVMTDLGMPEMSGWEVAQAVKARWPQLPVILVTGWGDALEGEQPESRGVDAVLAKPYTEAQLKHALVQGVALTRRGASERLR